MATFDEEYGVPPSHWASHLRLEAVAKLLRLGDHIREGGYAFACPTFGTDVAAGLARYALERASHPITQERANAHDCTSAGEGAHPWWELAVDYEPPETIQTIIRGAIGALQHGEV